MDGRSYWEQALSRRLSRRGVVRTTGLAGLAGAGLAVVGCGSSSNNKTGSTLATATRAAAAASAAPPAANAAAGGAASATAAAAQVVTPKPGGTLTARILGNAPLDPFHAATFRANQLSGYYYARLMKIKTGPTLDIAYQYEPEFDLATSVETPDLQTWTFKLRQNVAFHDIAPVSGRLLDAEDVVATWKRFNAAADNVNRPNMAMVDTVEAPDKQTVVFKLKFPYGPFKSIMATPSYFWIMPKEADAGFDPTKQPIGCGPFVFDGFQPDVSFKFKKFAKYWQTGKPYIDGVNLANILDNSNALAQLIAGNLDVDINIAPSDVATWKKSKPDANLQSNTSGTYGFLWGQMRDKSSPWNDDRLRHAVSLAVDRQALLDISFLGEGSFLTAFPASFKKWYLDPKGKDFGDAAKWYKPDPKAARQLLEASGQANTTFKYIYPNNAYGDVYNQYVDATRGMLADAGFKLQVVTVDYNKDYIKNDTGIFWGTSVDNTSIIYALETAFSDVDEFVYNQLHSKGSRNHAGINDPDLEALVQKQRVAPDDATRKKALDDLQRSACDKMYNVPTMIGNAYVAFQKWLKGYQPQVGYGYATEGFVTAWLDK